MEQGGTRLDRIPVPGQRLARALRKPLRRPRRRAPGRPTTRAIVPIGQMLSGRRTPKNAGQAHARASASGANEQEWVRSHWREYTGLWVALDGSRLVGVGTGARLALEQARALGVVSPFLVRVTEPSELPFGGW